MKSSGEESLQVVVPEGTRQDRADKMLARLHPELSRSRWQKLFHGGRVWREDEVLSQKSRLRAGDLVEFTLPAVQPLEIRPVAMDLTVLHEDASILVLDKPPGLVVHPGAGTGEDTMVHGILHHCRGSLSGIGGKERPGIVHRLDKETSGVIIVAKTDPAFQSLAEQFSGRSIRKYYAALVRGVPYSLEGSIDAAIGRHPVHRTRMACREDGRHALTDYSVQESWGLAALLRVRIHTGRTHQIRVHMKKLGHPLLGDAQYGYKACEGIPDVPRVMLHAARLEFAHPETGKAMVVEAPLPADFRAVMDQLGKLAQGPESH
ncbi:MAG: RluA family pseudouridine synthase [Opitutales bacterium]|jgi:23S rRNA pseudouridine1911/1915/1917 synthase